VEDRPVKATPYDDREDVNDFTRKLLADAWRKGYAARQERKPFRCTLSSYVKAAATAWEEGWRAAESELDGARKRAIETRVPDVKSHDPQIRPR
jgi:hypothetical protein